MKHEVTEKTREIVEILAGLKVSQIETARVLGVSVDTLKRRYKTELRLGENAGNILIAGRLVALAKKIQSVD